MYLAQAMIDSRSRFDHQCDRRDLLNLREEHRKQHASLLKAWKENKALQAFKDKYEPEKEKLQESNRKLSEGAWRNANEKNELKREIQALKDELSARQQKIDDLESTQRKDFEMRRKDLEEYDSRTQELSALNLGLNTTIRTLNDKLEVAESSHNDAVKSLSSEVTMLREESARSIEEAKMADLRNRDLQIELEEMRQALTDSVRMREETAKTSLEELGQLQADLRSALATRDEREAENHILTMTVSQMTAEISELERVKELRQQMLDDVSDFGPRVYRRWNLPRDFARKIAKWVSLNKDKVTAVRDRWARMDRGEELSSDEEIGDSDTEGVHLEDTDTDTDESGDESEGSDE